MAPNPFLDDLQLSVSDIAIALNSEGLYRPARAFDALFELSLAGNVPLEDAEGFRVLSERFPLFSDHLERGVMACKTRLDQRIIREFGAAASQLMHPMPPVCDVDYMTAEGERLIEKIVALEDILTAEWVYFDMRQQSKVFIKFYLYISQTLTRLNYERGVISARLAQQ